MQAWANWVGSIVVYMLPAAAVVAFWIYFVRRLRRHPELVDRTFQHMDRVEALLERIAKATEERPR
jgi:hypothetical protein